MALGLSLGGEPGERLGGQWGMHVSPETLLRCVRSRRCSPQAVPRVVGVDDWAFHKGHRYGTILVDLERRQPLDLLPDREPATLMAWLKARPAVEIITRDRSSK